MKLSRFVFVIIIISILAQMAFVSITSPSADAIKTNSKSPWVPKSNMLYKRVDFGAAVVDNKIYAIGGEPYVGSETKFLSEVEYYNPSDNTWIEAAEMPTERSNFALGTVNGKIYVIGGYNGEYLTTVECYDPAKDNWTTRPDMPTVRCSLEAGVVDGKLYAIGGYDGSNYLSTVECYDPATNTWSAKADLPLARSGFGIGVVSGKIYVIGGYNINDEYGYLNQVHCYDPQSDSWSAKSNMHTRRSTPGVGVVNDKIYAVGGYYYYKRESNTLASVERFDTLTNTWIEKEDMTSERARLEVAVINNNIYALGGNQASNSAYSTVEALDATDTDSDDYEDYTDGFPTDPSAGLDIDGDGYPDEWNEGMSESDSTTGLKLDAFPDDPTQWSDSDGDTYGDNLDGNYPDHFPTDPAASLDTDGDGYPDLWNRGMTKANSTTGLTLDEFPDDPDKWTTKPEEPTGINYWLPIIFLICFAILIVAVIVFPSKLQKDKVEIVYEPGKIIPAPPPEQIYLCPTCKHKLNFIKKHNRYYCKACRTYP